VFDNKKLIPPIVPSVIGEDDTRNYILYNGSSVPDSGVATAEDRDLFWDF